jgi:glycerol-3-phosphate O-acyltransferase/dihydroxyacetone phosphate acyltransferase
MALGAMANDPKCHVKIVPVGLSYFHAHRFRSRAVVEFGQALDVPPELVEKFKQGGAQKKEAISSFLDLIYNGLKTVTVRAPDYDTLMASIHYFQAWDKSERVLSSSKLCEDCTRHQDCT